MAARFCACLETGLIKTGDITAAAVCTDGRSCYKIIPGLFRLLSAGIMQHRQAVLIAKAGQ